MLKAFLWCTACGLVSRLTYELPEFDHDFANDVIFAAAILSTIATVCCMIWLLYAFGWWALSQQF